MGNPPSNDSYQGRRTKPLKYANHSCGIWAPQNTRSPDHYYRAISVIV